MRFRRVLWDLILACLLLQVAKAAPAQGLEPAPTAVAASVAHAAAADVLKTVPNAAALTNSPSWKAAAKLAAARPCGNPASSSLCAARDSAGQPDSAVVLAIAAAPRDYSSLDKDWTGGVRAVGAARDMRPCSASVAFAVVTAAETAVARATGKDIDSVGRLSAQDLAYCSPAGARGCSSSWSLSSALDALQSQPPLLESCLTAVYPPTLGSGGSTVAAKAVPATQAACNAARRCSDRSSIAAMGKFGLVPLESFADVQEHIRRWGSVITRFDIMSDFKPLFEAKTNAKKVYGPLPGAKLEGHTAIVLVGYSNDAAGGGYWIARNFHGPSWADDGSFRVSYDSPGLLTPGDTWGVTWTPSVEAPQGLAPTAPSTERPGCIVYQAKQGDYLGSIARRGGVPLEALLRDNYAIITDLGAPIASKALTVCPPATKGVPQDPLQVQLDALMDLKQSVDRTGLLDWTPASGRGGRYCQGAWALYIECDKESNVVGIMIPPTTCEGYKCSGALPGAAVLARLPKLRRLELGRLKLKGRLPQDYGLLKGLEELSIMDNPGLSGPLPAAWGGMRGLTKLTIRNTGIGGLLPAALGADWASSMRKLDLRDNAFLGPIPQEWSQMVSLQTLHLAGNKGLTGCLPKGLERLRAAAGLMACSG